MNVSPPLPPFAPSTAKLLVLLLCFTSLKNMLLKIAFDIRHFSFVGKNRNVEDCRNVSNILLINTVVTYNM